METEPADEYPALPNTDRTFGQLFDAVLERLAKEYPPPEPGEPLFDEETGELIRYAVAAAVKEPGLYQSVREALAIDAPGVDVPLHLIAFPDE